MKEPVFKTVLSKLRKRHIIETFAGFIAGGWLFLEFVDRILIARYHINEKWLDVAFITLLGALICVILWRWCKFQAIPATLRYNETPASLRSESDRNESESVAGFVGISNRTRRISRYIITWGFTIEVLGRQTWIKRSRNSKNPWSLILNMLPPWKGLETAIWQKKIIPRQ